MTTLTLPWPPTVNHYYTVARGRKILSAKGRKYRADAALLVAKQDAYYKIRTGKIGLTIRAYAPDKRKRDLDNLLKPILDALTYGNVYQDDSQVIDLRITKYYPNTGGRVEVVVDEIG